MSSTSASSFGKVGVREPPHLVDVTGSVEEPEERTQPGPVVDDRAG